MNHHVIYFTGRSADGLEYWNLATTPITAGPKRSKVIADFRSPGEAVDWVMSQGTHSCGHLTDCLHDVDGECPVCIEESEEMDDMDMELPAITRKVKGLEDENGRLSAENDRLYRENELLLAAVEAARAWAGDLDNRALSMAYNRAQIAWEQHQASQKTIHDLRGALNGRHPFAVR